MNEFTHREGMIISYKMSEAGAVAGAVAVLRLVAGWLGRLISASMFEKVLCMRWRRMYQYL